MKISVIIPTYNPQEYIWQCLQSLSNQTLSREEYEVVIVLNGCNSPYREMLGDGLKKHCPDLSVLLIQTDMPGVSNARNIGIDNSCGENIVFIDDDDYVSENFLSDLLKREDKSVVVVSQQMDFFESSDDLKKNYITKAFNANKDKELSVMSGHTFLSSACSKLIPRKIIADERFNTSIALGEDALFMAQISKRIKKIVLSSPDTIYYRRVRETSASHTRKSMIYYIKNAMRLNCLYTKIYFSETKNNNLKFFINRILANTKRMFLYLFSKAD